MEGVPIPVSSSVSGDRVEGDGVAEEFAPFLQFKEITRVHIFIVS